MISQLSYAYANNNFPAKLRIANNDFPAKLRICEQRFPSKATHMRTRQRICEQRLPNSDALWNGTRSDTHIRPTSFQLSNLYANKDCLAQFRICEHRLSIPATHKRTIVQLGFAYANYDNPAQIRIWEQRSVKYFEISVLRHIRFAELRKILIRLTTFNKYMCNWTLEVRDILKILWKRGEIRSNFSSFPQYFLHV